MGQGHGGRRGFGVAAGVALLRELMVDTGLAAGWSAAMLDTYKALPIHQPGRVLADLAVIIADGGDALAHLKTLRDQDKLFSAVASDATAWRVVDRVDEAHLGRLRAVRAAARERAWAAGAGPDLGAGLVIDLDATITVAHSEKENAAATWKETFGFHPPLAYLDRPDVAGGRGWPGCCEREARAVTPSLTMSVCWGWRWARCPRRPVRAPANATRRGC